MNKNGVMVTKYVRDIISESHSGKSIPAPYTAAPSEWKAQIEFLGKALHGTYEEYLEYEDEGISQTELESRISALDNNVLSAYYESILDNPGHGFEDILMSAMHNDLTSDEAGSILFIARLEGEMDLEWSTLRGGAFSYVEARRLHNGLDHYAPDLYFPPNLLTAPEEDQETAATLIDAVRGALEAGVEDESFLLDSYRPSQHSGGILAIDDESLVKLFLDYSDRTMEIIDMMNTRGTCEADSLRLVLDAEVTAVRDGIL
jgi:hypothetical protein